MKKITKIMFTLVVMVLATAINPLQLSNSYNDNVAQAATIRLNKKSYVLLKGQTYQLKVLRTRRKVKWSSSNKNICVVSAKGKITAKAKGTCYIYAKVLGRTLKCKIIVETPKISKTKLTLATDKSYQLKVTGTTAKIIWDTTNVSSCSVSKNGKIIGGIHGKATITAKVRGKIYKCLVTVPFQFKSNHYSLKVKKGETKQISISANSPKSKLNFSCYSYDNVDCKWGCLTVNKGIKKCSLSVKGLSVGESNITITNTMTKSKINIKVSVYEQKTQEQIATDNLKKLKTYISEKGDINSSGNRFISDVFYKDNQKYTYGIVYNAVKNEFNFVYSDDISQTNSKSTISINTSKIYNTLISCEYIVYHTDLKLGVSATAVFNAGEYSGTNDLHFDLIKNTEGVTEESVQYVANSTLKLCFNFWDTLLTAKVGLNLKDIGFNNYK